MMDSLVVCTCGHSIPQHADQYDRRSGCLERGCNCALRASQVLDAAIAAVRIEWQPRSGV